MAREFQNYVSLSIKLILVLSIINAIYNNLWHIMSADIFLLILMFAPQIIKKYEIKIPSEFEMLLLVFVVFTLFLGKLKGVIVPMFFGIAIAMIGFLILAILYSSNQIKKNYFLIILFSFNFAVAFGFALELIKYYLKIALGHNILAENFTFSMQTMTFVIFGAGISAVFGFIYMKGYAGIFGKVVKKIVNYNPRIFKKENSGREILELISRGESENLEFKETLRVNLHTNDIDRRIEHSVLKSVAGFLNSSGGKLLIGVKNNGGISGIEKDKFEDSDKFLLHFVNIVKQRIGKKYVSLIKTEVVKIDENEIVLVECLKSSSPVFLRNAQNQEEFYVRTGNSTTEIHGSDLIDYVGKRFGKG